MKKLTKALNLTKWAGISDDEALRWFLRAYREPPHSTTGLAPADPMFGYSRTSSIPRIEPTAAEV